jgi:hypothetical protein
LLVRLNSLNDKIVDSVLSIIVWSRMQCSGGGGYYLKSLRKKNC